MSRDTAEVLRDALAHFQILQGHAEEDLEELQRLLASMAVEVKAEVRFVPREGETVASTDSAGWIDVLVDLAVYRFATLTIPSPAPGTYDWIDAKGAVLSASGLFLEIHHASGITVYQAVQGQTVVTAVGLIGSQVEGRFTGTLRSTTDGSIITISGGAFSLTRLSDQN